MYEVIWSWASDRFIIRPLTGLSSVPSRAVGTLEECEAWLAAHT